MFGFRLRISKRDEMTVNYENWAMTYFPSGDYYIYKDGKEIAHGRYDAVIADSYNTGMPPGDRKENLERDLKSWFEKAIKGKVVD